MAWFEDYATTLRACDWKRKVAWSGDHATAFHSFVTTGRWPLVPAQRFAGVFDGCEAIAAGGIAGPMVVIFASFAGFISTIVPSGLIS